MTEPSGDGVGATQVSEAHTSGPVVITGLEGLEAHVGQKVGVSDWKPVVQEEITAFAKLTGDEQWIHVDPERAAEGPFGTTIQHGFLTLGMSTGLLWSVCVVEGFGVILNYGLNKVRFPSPLPVGSIRMHVEIAEVKQLEGGAEVVWRLTYEVEGKPKPCCVAELVFRYYG
jgi:acyl dehydratase